MQFLLSMWIPHNILYKDGLHKETTPNMVNEAKKGNFKLLKSDKKTPLFMNWYEELPPDFPPEEAISPKATYFRLGSIPPDYCDFWSHRKRFPFKKFKVDEYIAHSLSIFDNQEAAELLKRLLPAMR